VRSRGHIRYRRNDGDVFLYSSGPCCVAMVNHAEKQGVIFTAEARQQILDGFGPSKSGEDPFDATVGLLSMIEVVNGRRDEGRASTDEVTAWEGWILGQASPQSRAERPAD
jgi:hypothetical protein